MKNQFQLIKKHLEDLAFEIDKEDVEKGLLLVQDEENGIVNCLFDTSAELLVMEQPICPVPENNREELYEALLKFNRVIPHGAFCITDTALAVLFRATFRYEELTRLQIEGALRSLEQALSDYGPILVKLAAPDIQEETVQ